MNAEIELKLFFQPQDHDLLIKTLNELPNAVPQKTLNLSNGYFDTHDLQLRRWDMGLRVRGFNEQLEQTIKTAGSVVGGIHSRPEYNVSIAQKIPDLSLFPAEIWPAAQPIDALSASLECIFETNFQRQTWHIQHQNALVEIALDQGKIIAGSLSEAICELEFELLSGSPAALLSLAIAVAKTVPLRLGKASKAQRGYQLAGKSTAVATTPLDPFELPPSEPNAHSAQKTMADLLERWQLIEQRLCAIQGFGHHPLWSQLIECIELLGSATCQVTPDKSIADLFHVIKNLVKTQVELHNKQQDLTSAEQLAQLWRHPQYGQLQLALVSLALTVQA